MKTFEQFVNESIDIKRKTMTVDEITKYGCELTIGLLVKNRFSGKSLGEILECDGNNYVYVGKRTLGIKHKSLQFVHHLQVDKDLSNVSISKNIEGILEFLRIFDINVDYINVGKDVEMISFLPLNRIKLVEEKGLDYWDNNYRQELRIGRFIRSIVKNKMTDKNLEKLVNLYKASMEIILGKSDFKLVQGEEIRQWYWKKNYKKGGGQLNNSCMRYKKCQKKFNIYTKNPEVCRLLIKVDSDGLLLGRALVWKTNKGIYMDRAYTVNDHLMELFKMYASSKGWKDYYTYDNKYKMKVILKKGYGKDDECKYPYMDTFEYLNQKKGFLTSDDEDSWDIRLNCG